MFDGNLPVKQRNPPSSMNIEANWVTNNLTRMACDLRRFYSITFDSL